MRTALRPCVAFCVEEPQVVAMDDGILSILDRTIGLESVP